MKLNHDFVDRFQIFQIIVMSGKDFNRTNLILLNPFED